MKTTLLALFAAICLVLAAGAAPIDPAAQQDVDSILYQIQETAARVQTESFFVTLEDFDGPFQAEFLRAAPDDPPRQ